MKLDRRRFAGLCAGTAIAAELAPAGFTWAGPMEDFAPARLVGKGGVPLKASAIETGEALVFAYPFRGVPCFLINLGTQKPRAEQLTSPDDGPYANPAGAGPHENLVAFIAVCTHALSYPSPDGSVIRYATGGSRQAGAANRIVCCAHGSVFDPADGARPVNGPAPNPLMPVRLSYDAATDSLSATGAVGARFFERFFKAYKSDLIERFGPGGYRHDVGDTTAAVPLSEYSASVSDC